MEATVLVETGFLNKHHLATRDMKHMKMCMNPFTRKSILISIFVLLGVEKNVTKIKVS